MKRFLTTGIAICACLCLFTGCGGKYGGYIGNKMQRLDGGNTTYKLPYITAGADKEIINKINDDILRIAQDAVDQLCKDAIQCTVGYEVGCAQDQLFSTVLFIYAYSGGAHGSTAVLPLSFDLKTGEQILLQEQFEPGSEWQKVLLSYVAEDIENTQDYKDALTIPEEIPAKQTWSFTPEVMVLIYQEYEIGPYALGIPTFDIPLSEISNMFTPQSPLRRLVMA